MDTNVVDASIEDVEDLITIYSSPDLYHNREEANWFVKSFYDYHHIKVIKDKKKIIGAIFWNVVEEKHHGITEIGDLWIDENNRRKGLGEKLLRTAIEDMKQFLTKENSSLRKVLVTTGDDNEPAKKLYEKIGFKKSAILADLFAKGENELIYILTLNP
jgi:ribosomal protein S18 acetylase RimI-like enzyme